MAAAPQAICACRVVGRGRARRVGLLCLAACLAALPLQAPASAASGASQRQPPLKRGRFACARQSFLARVFFCFGAKFFATHKFSRHFFRACGAAAGATILGLFLHPRNAPHIPRRPFDAAKYNRKRPFLLHWQPSTLRTDAPARGGIHEERCCLASLEGLSRPSVLCGRVYVVFLRL